MTQQTDADFIAEAREQISPFIGMLPAAARAMFDEALRRLEERGREVERLKGAANECVDIAVAAERGKQEAEAIVKRIVTQSLDLIQKQHAEGWLTETEAQEMRAIILRSPSIQRIIPEGRGG